MSITQTHSHILPAREERFAQVFRNALRDAAWTLEPEAGVLVVSDADRVDFLQRMTTNNVAAARPGESVVTILTSPTARIVHVFTVLVRDDELWLLPAPGEAAPLARHLRGQIFFLDKVKVQDVSEAWRRIRIVGPNAAEALRQIAPFDAFSTHQWREVDGVIALSQDDLGIPGIELIVPTAEAHRIGDSLHSGRVLQIEDASMLEDLRVALGRPASGAELTTDYSPLEVGMDWACSENKGCYTGQEIIARQRTYDKVTRTLVGLRGDDLLEVGASLLHEGREVGKVTSVARHPESGAPIALAVVKRPAHASGTRLSASDEEVEVVSLPFTGTSSLPSTHQPSPPTT